MRTLAFASLLALTACTVTVQERPAPAYRRPLPPPDHTPPQPPPPPAWQPTVTWDDCRTVIYREYFGLDWDSCGACEHYINQMAFDEGDMLVLAYIAAVTRSDIHDVVWMYERCGFQLFAVALAYRWKGAEFFVEVPANTRCPAPYDTAYAAHWGRGRAVVLTNGECRALVELRIAVHYFGWTYVEWFDHHRSSCEDRRSARDLWVREYVRFGRGGRNCRAEVIVAIERPWAAQRHHDESRRSREESCARAARTYDVHIRVGTGCTKKPPIFDLRIELERYRDCSREDAERRREEEARRKIEDARRAAEAARLQKQDEEARRLDEECRRHEEEVRRAEAARRAAVEARRQAEEERRRAEAAANRAEEARHAVEAERLKAEAARKAEEDRRDAIRHAKEAEERRRHEADERRMNEEERRKAEAARKADHDRRESARTFVVALGVAVNLYFKENGKYPPGLEQLSQRGHNKRPYFEFAKEHCDAKGRIVDSWGRLIVFKVHASAFPKNKNDKKAHNKLTFDLCSLGADGRDDDGAGDDVANWDENTERDCCAKCEDEERRVVRDDQKRRDEDARKAAEENKRKQDEHARHADEERKKKDDEARKAEEERRKHDDGRKAEEERKRKDEEARKADEERQKKSEDARKADEEARRRAEEERKKKDEDAKKSIEERKQKAEEERRRKEEELRKADEERKRKDEEARKAADERKQKEDEAKKAEEERKKKEEEERKNKPVPPKDAGNEEKIAQTKALLGAIQSAIDAYQADHKAYPAADALAKALGSDSPKTKKPYLELKPEQLDKEGRIIDAWGRAFYYRNNAADFPKNARDKNVFNKKTYDVASNGPDGEFDRGGDDDIANWSVKK